MSDYIFQSLKINSNFFLLLPKVNQKDQVDDSIFFGCDTVMGPFVGVC